MDLLTHQDFRGILGINDLCVSILMPTHRTSPDCRQDPIRFKNLLRTANEKLVQQGVKPQSVRKVLEPAERWLDEPDFWRHQADGLAVFLTENGQQRFRLPRAFVERVHVNDHAHVNPLLPLLQANGTFFLLAVSQQSCRLLSGTRDTIVELDEANLPTDLRSALGWWRERELNLHTMQSRPQSRGGDDTAMFHGHAEDATKKDLVAYFRRVDAAVCDALRGERSPLVFAGVDYLFPIYRSVNNYAGLCETAVTGSSDNASPPELHRQAWQIVHPVFQSRERAVLQAYPDRAAQGYATDDRETLLRAAENGLVETLIIPQQEESQNRVDAVSEDLLDRASRLTLQTSGEVLAVDPALMPVGSQAAAVLRAPCSTIASSQVER